MDNIKKIWDHIKTYCSNDYGVAGLMGNLQAESGLVFNNLENMYNSKYHMTDAQYTAAVDAGIYNNFINDAAGYGLAQWTYWTRKRGLLDMAKKRGVSISDPTLQLDYLKEELTGRYKGVLNVMQSAASVRIASDAVMVGFENPANQSESAKASRARLGEKIYQQMHGGRSGGYIVTADILNIRSGAGLSYSVIGGLKNGAACDIVETVEADGYTWGRLSTGRGWVAVQYLKGV